MDIQLSNHAKTRAAQRNLSLEDICFIVQYGKRVRGTGGIFCQMYRKCMPVDLPSNHHLRRLVGATVLLSSRDETVITLYRAGEAFKTDRRKKKYHRDN